MGRKLSGGGQPAGEVVGEGAKERVSGTIFDKHRPARLPIS